jgi:hypothetical protein
VARRSLSSMFIKLRYSLPRRSPDHALSTNRQIPRGVSLWAKEEPMKPIRIPALNSEQLGASEKAYRTTRDVRLRTRARMVLL